MLLALNESERRLNMNIMAADRKDPKKRAMELIILFGLVSLFGDIIYEGARSVNGPYLQLLGANAAIVGLIAGIGEFIGYGIRLLSGYFSDKTKAYWVFVFIGYGLLISVPLLSLAGIWQMAAMFIVIERFGKALRSPARDTIVSQAAKQIGTGWGFALNEFLDQLGALSGPLIFTGLFIWMGAGAKTVSHYQTAYGFFWVPFALLVACVWIAFRQVPNPEKLDTSPSKGPENLTKIFWLYTFFTFITTIGFVNFILMGYHFKEHRLLSDAQIPLFYAVAMGVDAIAALIFGKMYDIFNLRKNSQTAGLGLLVLIPVLSAVIPFMGFSLNKTLIAVSIVLWGVVMGGHETIMKAAIADLTHIKKRGTGYGIFNTAYGVAMLIGGAGMGFLYEYSVNALIIATVAVEIIALAIFFVLRKEL
jgi:MFS family permease